MRRKPYENGYMDGYCDAAKVRDKYIESLLNKIDRLNFELEITNRKLTENKVITAEEQKFIELGRAFKKLTQEIKS